MRRFVSDALDKGATGNIAAMPMLAGESVGGGNGFKGLPRLWRNLSLRPAVT